MKHFTGPYLKCCQYYTLGKEIQSLSVRKIQRNRRGIPLGICAILAMIVSCDKGKKTQKAQQTFFPVAPLL